MSRALIVIQGDHDRDKACRWARGVPMGSRIEFKETKRTLPQNDLMWALLTEVSQQLDHGGRKYDPTEWKSIFLHAFGREITFLPSLDLKTFLPIELSSSDLGKDEMTNFIEFIIKEGTERGVVFNDHNTKASDAGGAQTSGDDGTATSPGDAVDEPAGETVSTAAGSEPSLFGKWNYQGKDLINLREFAKKAFIEARKDGDIPLKLQFLGSMHLNYLDAAESDDARKALNGMNKALELVMKGDRNVDRIEAWFETEFFSEA